MYYRSTGKSALLIGDNLYAKNNVLEALRSLGLQLRFSSSGYEAIGELYRDQPEIVFIDDSIADIGYAELCRHISLSDMHSSVPLICIFGGEASFPEVFDAYRSGADDCFIDSNSTTQMIAKIEWLIARKQSTASLRQYYAELRCRQSQTLDIVRATADLMESIDTEYHKYDGNIHSVSTQLFEERLDMGLGMIRSLASILEQQIDCFDISELIEQTDAPVQNALKNNSPRFMERASMEVVHS
jgi:DNA-binding response OmpR family regulator